MEHTVKVVASMLISKPISAENLVSSLKQGPMTGALHIKLAMSFVHSQTAEKSTNGWSDFHNSSPFSGNIKWSVDEESTYLNSCNKFFLLNFLLIKLLTVNCLWLIKATWM